MIVFVMAAMLASVSASTAAAGRGARSASGADSGATITFAPATVVVGQQYVVKVSGLRPNAWVAVGAYFPWPTLTSWCSKWTDNLGNWNCTFTAMEPGDILHEAHQMGRNGRFRLKASASLTISPSP